MDSKRLLIDIGSLLGKHADLRALMRAADASDLLKATCEEALATPEIGAALQRLQNERPDRYTYSLFCASLTLLLCLRLDVRGATLRSSLLAALLQDLGELEPPDPRAARKLGCLPRETHPLRSRECIDRLSGVPRDVSDIVGTHHERHDGLGYPEARLRHELSRPQLILILANEIARLRLGSTAACGTLADCLTLLRFSQGPHFTAECRAALAMLASGPPAAAGNWSDEEAAARIDRLTAETECLRKWLSLMDALGQSLGSVSMTRGVARCRILVSHLQRIAATTGLLDESMLAWARHVKSAAISDSYGEMEELSRMLHEFARQLIWVADFTARLAAQPGAERAGKLQTLHHAMQKLRGELAVIRGEDGLMSVEA